MTELEKEQKYKQLLKEATALLDGESDMIANMANLAALIHETMGFWWQGPIACTRIALGRGVCGTSWQRRETIVVPDVEKFPGHIACSSESRSEIVVPVFKADKVSAVLDIDSRYLNTFDETDARYLEQIVKLLN